MEHILVPILTPEDIAAIPRVVEDLREQSPLAVVIVHNPSLGVTSADATAKIDREIADLERSKKEAIQREDFTGADSFKRMIEDKRTERIDVLRDGWKSVPPDRLGEFYRKLTDPFIVLAPTYVTSFSLPDDTTHKNLLHSLTQAQEAKGWPECLPFDRYSLVRPLSIGPKKATPQPVEAVSSPKRVKTAPKASKRPVEANLSPREARRKELSRYMKMKAVAKTHGIEITNRPSVDVVAEILNREFPEAAAA